MTASEVKEKQYTILIVNENPKTLAGLTKAMHKMGFPDTVSVQNDEKAVLATTKKQINCIISAYEMNSINGLSFLRMIRKKKGYEDLPFFLTDPAFTTLKVLKAGQAGVTGLLVMPCTLTTLKEKITTTLSEPRAKVVNKAEKEVNKASELIDEGKFSEAIDEIQNIINQKENPEYYYNIGYIKSIQGKYSEAIAAFRKATQLDRLFAKAYEEMGRAYRALGQNDKADEYMSHAAQIHLERDNDGHAEEILNEILELGSDSLNVFNSLGVIYRRRGDHRTALNHYNKALRVHPDEPNIYYNIGRIHLDMKDMEKARELFQKAVEIDNSFIEAKQVIKAIDLGVI
ncbi:Tetratricopeptide TPR_1 repeat-containing protein [Desulfamplus magnetovallimortis]|uniref:Tetratricopeptide TPR_1 repeat-containing protein n=1 Tax=Desulfamplus magnetovallimortis TaxID=1246637 RepID=A0A1W1HCJ1_9BACT|nr:tetratricopeptide repeat protein [Desulfamplus magnetovallimortis]SLM30221.1 Tetratricopeptide TPR_1 repeat-containing protein [Desulfamplus magnetovallimortis]